MIKDLTINQIRELINLLADTEYQRGYADGLKEQIATEKHWGKGGIVPAPPKQTEKCCKTCEYQFFSSKVRPCKNCGTRYESYRNWTPKKEDKTE